MAEPVTTSMESIEQGTSLWQDAWIKLRKNRLALCGLITLGTLCLACLVTPWIAPYGYEEQNLALGASPPSLQHWLGTDIFGRDMLTRILYEPGLPGCRFYCHRCGAGDRRTLGCYCRLQWRTGGCGDDAYCGYSLRPALYDFIVLLMVVFGRNIPLLFVAIGAVEWLTMAQVFAVR